MGMIYTPVFLLGLSLTLIQSHDHMTPEQLVYELVEQPIQDSLSREVEYATALVEAEHTMNERVSSRFDKSFKKAFGKPDYSGSQAAQNADDDFDAWAASSFEDSKFKAPLGSPKELKHKDRERMRGKAERAINELLGTDDTMSTQPEQAESYRRERNEGYKSQTELEKASDENIKHMTEFTLSSAESEWDEKQRESDSVSGKAETPQCTLPCILDPVPFPLWPPKGTWAYPLYPHPVMMSTLNYSYPRYLHLSPLSPLTRHWCDSISASLLNVDPFHAQLLVCPVHWAH